MSNFSYDDFAVLVRSFDLGSLDLLPLCIVPLSEAPSMAEAIKGKGLVLEGGKAYLPIEKNGSVARSNVTVQHKSDGYCRLVGHLEPEVITRMFVTEGGTSYSIENVEGEDVIYVLGNLYDLNEMDDGSGNWSAFPRDGEGDPLTGTIQTAGGSSTAKAFVLYQHGTEGNEDKVIAVASLKEGFEIGEGCYPSFTITTVNNYQSVAFNPNAFATMEDLKNINGLDGLHIAFDQATGDIKLLDKDGNVIDQANLPIKADVIIADGEEGYKYVKTDIPQDIHAAKAWMPEGATAWGTVDEVKYTMQHAALVVASSGAEGDGTRWFVTTKKCEIQDDIIHVDGRDYQVSRDPRPYDNLFEATAYDQVLLGTIEQNEDGNDIFVTTVKYEIKNLGDGDKIFLNEQVFYIVQSAEGTQLEAHTDPLASGAPFMTGTLETDGGASTSDVIGIAVARKVDGEYEVDEEGKVRLDMYAIDKETLVPSVLGDDNAAPWLVRTQEGISQDALSEMGYSLRYSLEAFVWTVKDPDAVTQGSFFADLNDSLKSLGFHDGDDIALGTNLSALADIMDGRGDEALDPEDYMHSEENMADRAEEVAYQRNLAKEELVAWNAQHPALTHNPDEGTRISSEGVDIRNGSLLIGNGSNLDNLDNEDPLDAVKHYELSTNFSDADADADTGLALSVMDDSDGEARNVLTISESSYISGAPICMAMIEITSSGIDGDEHIDYKIKRRTACFDCDMSENDGTVDITITDNRSNSKGFSGDCIVEISPVYLPGVPTPTSDETSSEMLPALNTVNTVATVSVSEDNKSQLTCTCPQIIDWANSVNLNEGGARLFAIVKVY